MATWWCCRYPRPASPAREPRRPLTPAAGEEEGSRRRKLSRKRARRPHFPGEAAGGVAQPAGPGSRRRLDGVSARRRELGSAPERGPRLPSSPLCLGLRRQREPDTVRWAERLSGVAARVPPPLPCPSPAANCRTGQIWGQRTRWMVGIREDREDCAKLEERFSPAGPGDSQAGRGRARGRGRGWE